MANMMETLIRWLTKKTNRKQNLKISYFNSITKLAHKIYKVKIIGDVYLFWHLIIVHCFRVSHIDGLIINRPIAQIFLQPQWNGVTETFQQLFQGNVVSHIKSLEIKYQKKYILSM